MANKSNSKKNRQLEDTWYCTYDSASSSLLMLLGDFTYDDKKDTAAIKEKQKPKAAISYS